MSMLDQEEKRRVLENDRKATFFQFAQSAATEIGGRFATQAKQTVVGTTPSPYPQLPSSSPWAGPDPVPDEPPTGYRVDDLEHPTSILSLVGAGPTSDAPAPSVERDVGSISTGDLAKPTFPLTSAAGSPVPYRRLR
jgi:hypothetical protein